MQTPHVGGTFEPSPYGCGGTHESMEWSSLLPCGKELSLTRVGRSTFLLEFRTKDSTDPDAPEYGSSLLHCWAAEPSAKSSGSASILGMLTPTFEGFPLQLNHEPISNSLLRSTSPRKAANYNVVTCMFLPI